MNIPDSSGVWRWALLGLTLAAGQGCGRKPSIIAGAVIGETCKPESPCETGLICADGACRTPCNYDTDCENQGDVCKRGVCETGTRGQCQADQDCRTPPLCHSAVGAKCRGDGSCDYDYTLPLPTGTVCEKADPCQTDTRCDAAGDCVGRPVTCMTPPLALCVEDNTVYRDYTDIGTCLSGGGGCVYDYQDTACADCDVTCLMACTNVLCVDDQGGCRGAGYCNPAATPPGCVYPTDSQKPDDTLCLLPTDTDTQTGHCLGGLCIACRGINDCAAPPGDAGCFVRSCSSVGQCDYALQLGAVCEPSTCGSGVQTNALVCNDQGICPDAGTTDCGGFECNVARTACLTTCNGDGDCRTGYFCATGGVCGLKLADGQACNYGAYGGRDCQNGHCQNGYCCATGDCCAAVGDCTRFNVALSCSDQANCQGTGKTYTCNSQFVCEMQANDDDRVCNGLVGDNCGNFADYVCQNLLSQPQPTCPSTCMNSGTPDDAFCDAGRICQQQSTQWVCLPPAGAGNCCSDTGCPGATCGVGLHCDNTMHICCGTGLDCCKLDGDCSSLHPGFKCDTGAAACFSTCGGVDAYCVAGYHCTANACVTDLVPGSACNRDGECGSKHCNNNICCASGSCCNNDSTCGDYKCIIASHTCNPTCSTGAECVASAHCDSPACSADLPNGQPCQHDDDCISNNCSEDFASSSNRYCAPAGQCAFVTAAYAVNWVHCAADGSLSRKCLAAGDWDNPVPNPDTALDVCNYNSEGNSTGTDPAATCSEGTGFNDQPCGSCYGYLALTSPAVHCGATCASNNDNLCWPSYHCDATNACAPDKVDGDSCSENSDCLTTVSYCAPDFDLSASFCAPLGKCVHGVLGSPALGAFYTTGDGVCASDNSFYKKCQAGGSWSSQFNNPQASPNVCDAGGGVRSGYHPVPTCVGGAAPGWNDLGCQPCNPYRAKSDASGCMTSCPGNDDAECWDSAHCDTTTCNPDWATGHACERSLDCVSNNCGASVCCASGSTCCSIDGDCTDYKCNTGTSACRTTCGGDGDCQAAAHCDAANHCVPDRANGQTCTAAHDCTSNNCAEDFLSAGTRYCAPANQCTDGGTIFLPLNAIHCASGNTSSRKCIAEGDWDTVVSNPNPTASLCNFSGQGTDTGVLPAATCTEGTGFNSPACASCNGYKGVTSPAVGCGATCAPGNDGLCWPSYYCDGANTCQADSINGAACTRAAGCLSNNCAQDFVLAVKFCAPANQCVHQPSPGTPGAALFFNITDGECASDNTYYKTCQAALTWSGNVGSPQPNPVLCVPSSGPINGGYSPPVTCVSGPSPHFSTAVCNSCFPYFAKADASGCQSSCATNNDALCWTTAHCDISTCNGDWPDGHTCELDADCAVAGSKCGADFTSGSTIKYCTTLNHCYDPANTTFYDINFVHCASTGNYLRTCSATGSWSAVSNNPDTDDNYCLQGGDAQGGYDLKATCTEGIAGGPSVGFVNPGCVSCIPFRAQSMTGPCNTTCAPNDNSVCSTGNHCFSGNGLCYAYGTKCDENSDCLPVVPYCITVQNQFYGYLNTCQSGVANSPCDDGADCVSGSCVSGCLIADSYSPTECNGCGGVTGSCPFIYAWDGAQYQYITDDEGNVLGFPKRNGAGPQVQGYGPHTIVLGNIAPHADGLYRLSLREPLREIDYVDQMQLLVVDHRPDVDIVSASAGNSVTWGVKFRDDLTTVSKALRLPVKAVDSRGRDVLREISGADGLPVPDDKEGPYTVTLDFGRVDDWTHARLVIDGWSMYGPAWRADAPVRASVRVQNAQKEWVVAKNIDVPSGDLKRYVVDLGGIFLTSDHRLQVQAGTPRSGFGRSILDRVALDTRPQVTVVTYEAPLLDASLGHKGVMAHERGNFGHRILTYEGDAFATSDHYGIGTFTDFGPVAGLLGESDDIFVVMQHGDELAMTFAAPPPVPAGLERTFVLRTRLFYEDHMMTRVQGLLPFAAMSEHPYAAPEHYPDDTAHTEYLRAYNHRQYVDAVIGTLPGGVGRGAAAAVAVGPAAILGGDAAEALTDLVAGALSGLSGTAPDVLATACPLPGDAQAPALSVASFGHACAQVQAEEIGATALVETIVSGYGERCAVTTVLTDVDTGGTVLAATADGGCSRRALEEATLQAFGRMIAPVMAGDLARADQVETGVTP